MIVPVVVGIGPAARCKLNYVHTINNLIYPVKIIIILVGRRIWQLPILYVVTGQIILNLKTICMSVQPEAAVNSA